MKKKNNEDYLYRYDVRGAKFIRYVESRYHSTNITDDLKKQIKKEYNETFRLTERRRHLRYINMALGLKPIR